MIVMLKIIMLADTVEYGSAEYLGGVLFDIFNAGILFFILFFDFKEIKN